MATYARALAMLLTALVMGGLLASRSAQAGVLPLDAGAALKADAGAAPDDAQLARDAELLQELDLLRDFDLVAPAPDAGPEP